MPAPQFRSRTTSCRVIACPARTLPDLPGGTTPTTPRQSRVLVLSDDSQPRPWCPVTRTIISSDRRSFIFARQFVIDCRSVSRNAKPLRLLCRSADDASTFGTAPRPALIHSTIIDVSLEREIIEAAVMFMIHYRIIS